MFNNNKIKRNWRSSDVKKFLTFTANTAGSTVKLTSFHEDSVVYNSSTRTVPVECKCPYLLSLEYSTNGINWQAYNFSEVYDENDNLIGYDGLVITLPRVGDFLIIRATRSNANLNPNGGWCNWFTGVDPAYLPPTGWYQFVLSGSVAASGNLQSLIYKNLNSNTGIGQFYRLFKNCTQLTTAPYLGATILRKQIYRETFMGCTNIEVVESAPNLQNGGGAAGDFDSMFEGCTSLKRFTNIHVTKGFNSSYAGDSFWRMFFGCSSLEEMPLYDTTLNHVQDGAYGSTFEGCTSLTDASEYRMYSPHTAVYHSGQRTFYGCSSLKYPPFLNKYILNVSWGNGNEGLKFAGCSSLKEIIYDSQELPQNTDTSAAWTRNWVDGVPATGNFFIGKDCPKIYSKHFIPYGWNINEVDDRPLCFETETADNSVMLAKVGEPYEWNGLQYSTDGTTWQAYEFNTWIGMPNIGDKVYFRSIDRSNSFTKVFRTTSDYYRFKLKNYTTARAKCSGNLFAIIRYLGTRVELNDAENEDLFCRLFQVCKITTTPDIPDITLPYRALTYIFIRTAITEFVLNKKSQVQTSNYTPISECVRDIQTLTSAKIFIRSVQLKGSSMSGMFNLSANLARIETYLDNWTVSGRLITPDWVKGVTNQNGVFVCPKSLEEIHDNGHIPVGWTVKRWYEEMGEQYQSVAALMQQYTDLEDVVDTYPNVAAILDQYPNLVHSLVDTGQRPYVTFGVDAWDTGIYPHNYMEVTLHYNKVASDNRFMILARRNSSSGDLALFHHPEYLRMLFGAQPGAANPQGVARYGGTGEHEMYISKDSITYDGVETIKDTCIKLGDFDSTYYLSNKILIYGKQNASDTTTSTTAKFYSLKIKEYGTLTHHFVPVADGVIADIADLDEVKIYTKDDATAIFGLE